MDVTSKNDKTETFVAQNVSFVSFLRRKRKFFNERIEKIMRKLSFLLACILALSCIVPMTVYAEDTATEIVTTNSSATYIARYAPSQPSIWGDSYRWDKSYSVGLWKQLTPAPFNPSSVIAPPRFKVVHDDDCIYIVFQYADDNPTINDTLTLGFYLNGTENKCANGCTPYTPENCSKQLCENHIVYHFVPPIDKATTAPKPNAGICYDSTGWVKMINGDQAVGTSFAYRNDFSKLAYYGDGGGLSALDGKGTPLSTFEIRIPKADLGLTAASDAICMEIGFTDADVKMVPDEETGEEKEQWTWNAGAFAWSNTERLGAGAVFDYSNYGTVILEGKEAAKKVYASAYAETAPKVWGDAYRWDDTWKNATWTKFTNNSAGTDVRWLADKYIPEYTILNDDDCLYIGVKVDDSANGTIYQKKNGVSDTFYGAEALLFGFIDPEGNYKVLLITAPGNRDDDNDANYTRHTEISYYDAADANQWLSAGPTGGPEVGTNARVMTARQDQTGMLGFEMRLPLSMFEINEDNTIDFEMVYVDSAPADQTIYGGDAWSAACYTFSGPVDTHSRNLAGSSHADNFGKIQLAQLCAHEAVEIPAVDATCTTDGNAAGTKCAICGKILSGAEVIPAAHKTKLIRENESVVEGADQVTCDEVAVCTVCGEEVSRTTKTVKAYTAVYAKTRPSIDGKGNDAAWATATEVTAAGEKTSSNTGTATPPTFKIMHDDNYVYTLAQYNDPNGTIDEGKGVGNDYIVVAFSDKNGAQREFFFSAPVMAEGSTSSNAWCAIQGKWVFNCKSVADDEEGFRAWAVRTGEDPANTTVVWEMRIPKADIGSLDDIVGIEMYLNDSAMRGEEKLWTIEAFAWARNSFNHYDDILHNVGSYGALVFEAPAHVHTEVAIPAVEATCTVEGFTAGVKCETCGEILKAPESLGMLEHKAAENAEWVTDENNHWHVCTTCDEVIDRGAHDAEPVCGTCGYAVHDVVYTIGSAEGAVGKTVKVPISITTYVPSAQYAADLNYDTEKLEFVRFTDFTDLGLSDINGGKLCDPEFASLGFIWEDLGLYTGILCYAEFKILAESEEPIPVTLIADREGTCHKNAKVVGGLITVVVPAVCPHENTEVITGKAATCTEPGLTDGVKCSDCGEILTAQEETKALGHTNGEAVIENETKASCTGEGSYDEVVYCAVCKAEVSRVNKTVDALDHSDVYVADETYHWLACSVCGRINGEKALHEGEGTCDICENAFAPIKNGLIEDRFYVNNAVIDKIYALHEYEGKTYYISDGYMILKNGVAYVAGDLMAFGENGVRLTGNAIVEVNGAYYAFENGVRSNVIYDLFTTDDGKTYYIGDAYQIMTTAGEIWVNGELMAFGEGGALLTGNAIVEVNGAYYAFENGVRSHAVYTTFETADGTYYIGDAYAIVTDTIVWINSEPTYFGADGKMATGTFILNDNVYVNGEMVKAYQAVKVGDVYYYVSDGHKIARSTSVYINDPAIASEARYYEVNADGIIQLPKA